MKYILVAWVIFSAPLIAQKQVVELDNITYSNFIKEETAFSLSNSETGELALVIPDKRTVAAYLFNENFELTDSITAESLRIKFKDIIGYRVTDTHYTTLFATENKHFLGVVDFDFETGKTRTEQLDINLSSEEVLETVTHNNRFFLLSINDDFEGLIVRELMENGTLHKTELKINEPVSIKDLLTRRNKPDEVDKRKGSVFNEPFVPEIVEIDNKNPNSLETTSKLNKLYAKDNNLILTFDNFEAFTLVYFIDLSDFSVTEKRFPQEMVDGKYLEKSNSFLFEEKLFQIAVSDDKLILNISDFKTGDIIRSFRATKERPIIFKNTNLNQKNGMFMGINEIRYLDDTAQFLRKVNNGLPGIAITQINNNYQLTIGGTQVLGGGGGGMMMAGGGVVGGAAGGMVVSIYFNPTYSSYGSYNNTKSIYIESIFDAQFNHIQGYPLENVFDKVKMYQDSFEKISAEEVFAHNGKLYFGYYNKKSEVYNIVEFEN